MHRVPAGLILAFGLTGCYVNQPLVEDRPLPALGSRLVVELNDAGRASMALTVGPSVASVEGALLERSDSQFVLAVSQVHGLWGSLSRWEGERVTFRPEQIQRMSLRVFSPGRTAALFGGSTVGMVAYVLTRSLIGGGNEPINIVPPPPGNVH
jgi:hypothetical protein